MSNEYVKKMPLLSAKQIEYHVERNIVSFFHKLGFEIKKVRRGITRTVDYEYAGLGIEVTLVESYFSKNTEVDRLLKNILTLILESVYTCI